MKSYEVVIVMQHTYPTYVQANSEHEALELALEEYRASGGDENADLQWSEITCYGEDEEEDE